MRLAVDRSEIVAESAARQNSTGRQLTCPATATARLVLKRDPVADIGVLHGGRKLAWVIKDGSVVPLGADAHEDRPVAFLHTPRQAA